MRVRKALGFDVCVERLRKLDVYASVRAAIIKNNNSHAEILLGFTPTQASSMWLSNFLLHSFR
jgi:hypothetical protein